MYRPSVSKSETSFIPWERRYPSAGSPSCTPLWTPPYTPFFLRWELSVEPQPNLLHCAELIPIRPGWPIMPSASMSTHQLAAAWSIIFPGHLLGGCPSKISAPFICNIHFLASPYTHVNTNHPDPIIINLHIPSVCKWQLHLAAISTNSFPYAYRTTKSHCGL